MKNKRNRQIGKGMGLLLCATLLLSGCGQARVPENVDITSLVISAKGSVQSYLVEEFDKDYYSVSDLADMVVQEAADYNTGHQTTEVTPVTVEKVEVLANDSSKVVVVQQFDSAATYEDFNEGVLYFGHASNLPEERSIDGNLVSAKDGTAITADLLQKELEKKHIVITDAKAVIYCPYPVAYVSDGAVCREDGGVDTTQAEGLVTILLKK